MYMEPSNVYISGILAEEEAIQWPLQPGEPVLARLAEKYDYEQIGQGRLTNDALIAMSS
jgi:hypothetical protein